MFFVKIVFKIQRNLKNVVKTNKKDEKIYCVLKKMQDFGVFW